MPSLQELNRYIFPLLTSDDARPGVFGTAFLCGVGTHRFIATAAHVLDQDQARAVYFGRGVVVTPTTTEVITSGLPASGNRADDEIDVAVFRPGEESVAALLAQGCRVIPLEDGGVEDESAPGDRYVFSGFPSNRSRLHRATHTLDPGAVSANCLTASNEELLALGLNPGTHIAVQFDRERMANPDGRQMTAPEPWGMSGGPVWKLRRNSGDYVLVGLGTAFRSDRNLLVATRIGAVVALLRNRFPETRAGLRAPRYFSVGAEPAL